MRSIPRRAICSSRKSCVSPTRRDHFGNAGCLGEKHSWITERLKQLLHRPTDHSEEGKNLQSAGTTGNATTASERGSRLSCMRSIPRRAICSSRKSCVSPTRRDHFGYAGRLGEKHSWITENCKRKERTCLSLVPQCCNISKDGPRGMMRHIQVQAAEPHRPRCLLASETLCWRGSGVAFSARPSLQYRCMLTREARSQSPVGSY